MNNFLDKAGLQHVIEKIKGMLSGYLPLEKGGTLNMTGLSSIQMLITATQDIEAVPFYRNYFCELNTRIKIPKNTNFYLDKDIWFISNPDYVESIIVKGGFSGNYNLFKNLKTFKSNSAFLLFEEVLDSLFYDCTKLTYVDINDLVISIATTLNRMFYFCSALSNITLNNWDTRNVTNTSQMFGQCQSLENLDITGWNMTNVTDMEGMFNACFKIKNLLLSEGFGRMKDEVGTLDLSTLTNWTNDSVQTLLTLYDRKANGMGVITIKLSEATKNALGASGIQTLTAKGYTIA